MIINFKFTETTELPDFGLTIVEHDVFIDQQEIQGWDLITYKVPVREEGEEQPTVKEFKTLNLVLKEKHLRHEIVEVPRLVKKGNDLETVYDKKVVEVSKNIVYQFNGEDIDKVLPQLMKLPVL